MPSLRLLALSLSPSLDRHSAARTIEDDRPDVVCVHHAPSLLRWRSLSAAIARESGLVVVGGGRTGGGNLLLSTLGVDVEGTRDLTFTGGHGPRSPGATLAAMRRLGSGFRFVGARLADAKAVGQLTELDAAAEALVSDDRPQLWSVTGVDPENAARTSLARGLLPVAAGVFADERITVSDVVEIATGVVRVDLELPAVD